ncbi:TonB-dependent receptor [Croceicoccus sediminis]|uniref:TonB-dependent receptor n=1 Tax=Croceicoccus sediminis TaxID=2571150 RepID=UPI00118273F5|nr:TonB-dependent receptor [Croceicoccus sediminis]
MKTTLFGAVALSALMIGQPAFAAAAQDGVPTNDGASSNGASSEGLGAIVVTAQRRTENLQDVAIAATALDASALDDKGIMTIEDLQTATPSLSVTNSGITQSINIRGIGIASNSPNVTAGVATYVDGLFQPPIVQANSFYDLASVEVLRGPQGTLVGSNSTGGAIFINSQSPTFDRVKGYAQASVGNFDARGVEGALNVPVSQDFAVRAAGFYARHDSYYNDVGPFDNDAGKLDEWGGRLGLKWEPGSFQALAKLQLNDRKTGGYANRPIAGTQFGDYRVGDIYTLSYDTPTKLRERALIASLELKQEFDSGIVLRSLSGYQYKRINALTDVDASQAPVQVGGDISEDYFAGEKQYSQEFNLISPTEGRFDWILGAYFQRNDIDVRILDTQAGFPTYIDPVNKRTTTGIFAQGNYEITPDLEFQLGARYSHYSASGSGQVVIGDGIPGFPPGGIPVADLSGSHKDGLVTGKVALNWTVSPDNLLYVFAARGYKPGGFNSETSEFDPEVVWNYEAGWKSTLLDGHLRTQINAFYNDYKNFQFAIVEPSTGFTGVQNIAKATIKGIEAQAQGRFGGLTFDAGVSYVDSNLAGLTFVNTRAIPQGTLGPQCPVGTPSTPPICFDYTPAIITTTGGPNLYSPKWTYNLGAAYEFYLTDAMTLTPRVNYSHQSSRFTYLAYSPDSDVIGAHGLLSAKLTLSKDDWFIEAYGSNLDNKRYIAGQTDYTEFYGAPREYGVRVGMTF